MKDLLEKIKELSKLAERPMKVVLGRILTDEDTPINKYLEIEVGYYDVNKRDINLSLRNRLCDVIRERIGLRDIYEMDSKGMIPKLQIPLHKIKDVYFNSIQCFDNELNSTRYLPSVSIVFDRHIDLTISEYGLQISAPEQILDKPNMLNAKSDTTKLNVLKSQRIEFWID